MQCRICLEEADPHEMRMPCQCRGTAAYIHRVCLEKYIQHYPDGICRVCKTPFTVSRSIGETMIVCCMVSLFTYLLLYSRLDPLSRLGLFLAILASILIQLMFRLFDGVFFLQIFALVVVPLSIGNVPELLTYLGFVILTTAFYFGLMYIAPQPIIMLGMILLVTAYASMFLLSLLMIDLHGFVVVFALFGVFLRAWARCHPPLWMRIEE